MKFAVSTIVLKLFFFFFFFFLGCVCVCVCVCVNVSLFLIYLREPNIPEVDSSCLSGRIFNFNKKK